MQVWQRVLAYGAALVVVLLVAIGIGRLVGPIEEDDAGHDAGHGPDEAGHGDHDTAAGPAHDLRLAIADDVLDAGRPRVSFAILDEAGEPLTSYDVQHEKELHLIAVRSDRAAKFYGIHGDDVERPSINSDNDGCSCTLIVVPISSCGNPNTISGSCLVPEHSEIGVHCLSLLAVKLEDVGLHSGSPSSSSPSDHL